MTNPTDESVESDEKLRFLYAEQALGPCGANGPLMYFDDLNALISDPRFKEWCIGKWMEQVGYQHGRSSSLGMMHTELHKSLPPENHSKYQCEPVYVVREGKN